jgi:hypothetical protein
MVVRSAHRAASEAKLRSMGVAGVRSCGVCPASSLERAETPNDARVTPPLTSAPNVVSKGSRGITLGYVEGRGLLPYKSTDAEVDPGREAAFAASERPYAGCFRISGEKLLLKNYPAECATGLPRSFRLGALLVRLGGTPGSPASGASQLSHSQIATTRVAEWWKGDTEVGYSIGLLTPHARLTPKLGSVLLDGETGDGLVGSA